MNRASAEEPLPQAQIAQRAKAASALVECQTRRGFGSAFCVDPAGLYLTNEHVVRGESKVVLILNPGEKTQKLLAAKILSASKDLDLAVLGVHSPNELAALPLGSSDGLAELDEIVTCGFPFGTGLAPDRHSYPAATINKGSITSLRKKDGVLHRIQLDAALNPGHSGGPVLDRQGRVVGVIAEGIKGAGVNFAIPVSHVRRFLDGPVLDFLSMTVTVADPSQPVWLEARQFLLLADAKPAELELIITRDGKEATYRLQQSGNVYRAQVNLGDNAQFSKPFEWTLIARRDNREVKRLQGKLTLRAPLFRDPTPVPITVPALEGAKSTVPLPAPATDVLVGGGGRYLVFHLASQGKLALFDASQAKLVQTVAAPAGDIRLAAGMDKLLVARVGDKVLERWNLKTLEREATAPLDLKVPVVALAIGSASAGPVLVEGCDWPRLGECAFYDIDKMKRIGFAFNAHDFFKTQPGIFVRASADGRVFTNQSYAGSQSAVWNGKDFEVFGGPAGLAPVPGADGSVIFTTKGVHSDQLIRQPGDEVHCLPATHGSYYLSVTPAAPRTVAVHTIGWGEPLMKLTDVDGLHGQGLPLDRRVHFIPEAKLLVVVPPAANQLLLYRLDVEQVVQKAGTDYILVTSRPPGAAHRGHSYRYSLTVLSKQGGLRYRLDDGPPGMEVSSDGKLTWSVPAHGEEPAVDVSVRIQDQAGNNCRHQFRIPIAD